MQQGFVILAGIVSGLVLIFSCISLNAAQFYSELEGNKDTLLKRSSSIVWRDRTSHLTLNNSRLSKELK